MLIPEMPHLPFHGPLENKTVFYIATNVVLEVGTQTRTVQDGVEQKRIEQREWNLCWENDQKQYEALFLSSEHPPLYEPPLVNSRPQIPYFRQTSSGKS